MKSALKLLTFLNMAFLLLLSLSGSFSGVVGQLLYYLAFALPFYIGWRASLSQKREREERAGHFESEIIRVGIKREGVLLSLPLVMPTVLVILLLALLTSYILGLFGFTGSVIADRPLVLQLALHALIPAVLEELLFRFLPIRLLAPYSSRAAVLISALYFSLIHLDLFTMPYAFAAGVIFAAVDIATGSILPSVVIHFLNNALSVVNMKYGESEVFLAVYFGVIALLAILSLVFVFLRKREYISAVRTAFSRGVPEYDYSPVLLGLLCIGSAIFNLYYGGANG